MAVIGIELAADQLVLTRGRDFKWTFENLDEAGNTEDFPVDCELYFEIYTAVTTQWDFVISGATATLKVESTAVDAIPDRIGWQLVFLADGEAAGGDAVARGKVKVQV